MNNLPNQRRRFLKSSALGLIGISAFGYSSAQGTSIKTPKGENENTFFYRYPSMNDEMVSTVVGAAHRDFDKVKEMVSRRPELAKVSWDWGFGDWESPLGAASHVGRKDIVELLISYGARPDIFTFAMLGMLKSVQEMVENFPGIQSTLGPHGITLLQHAKNRLSDKTISDSDKSNADKMIAYLESLGTADQKPKRLEVTEDEKKKYMGEYRFGEGEGEVFVVNTTQNGNLKMGRKGAFGNFLSKIDENTFTPAGAVSVKIIFKMQDDKAVSVSVHEPEPLVTAVRI